MKVLKHNLQLAGILSVVCAVFLFSAPAQNVEGVSAPSGQTPPQVLNGVAARVSHYEPSQMLRLAFVLTPPHPTEERQFLENVQNKQSPLFHQFLSPAEWTDRFGPSAEDEQAVVDWANSQGLTVTHRYNNRLLVDVEAQAGVVEKALHITMNNYRLPALEGQAEPPAIFANDGDPVFPSRLSNVIESVQGLNSFEGVRPASNNGDAVIPPDYAPGPVVTELAPLQNDAIAEDPRTLASTGGGSPAFLSAPPAGATPDDYWESAAYDYTALMALKHCCNPNNWSTGSGANSSIAVAAFGHLNMNDVAGFQEDGFPYLAINVVPYAIDGTYTCVGTLDNLCVEVTLDTEWSLATANNEGAKTGTATVYVYEGANFNNSTVIDVYNQILDDSHARVFTTSYVCSENNGYSGGDCYGSTMAARDHILSAMAGQGWTLVAASGDRGATGDCSDALGLDFPASDPNVVAAGGTTLHETSGSPYEEAWIGGSLAGSCATNEGGGTGGFSNYFAAPGYQSPLGFLKRAVPDVSLSTGAHDIYFGGGWFAVGGTSAVAPMLAGFFAQEDSYLIALGDKCGTGTAACAPLGNANYPIYLEGRYVNAGHYPFYDILEGCNSNDITLEYGLTAYCSKPGIDQTTGWGSANMLQLAWAINWYTAAADGFPSVSYTGPATGKWYNDKQIVSWTIVDNAGTGFPGTGIAGFTQGWDSIPPDSYSQPHGGSADDSFFRGPEYVNAKTGCMSLVSGGGCAGGVSQGCHTVHVRGWNNQGMTTGDTFYGPLCYDNVPPTIGISLNPATPSGGWYNRSVAFTLSASDPGGSGASGVSKIYYALNTVNCYPNSFSYCTVYSGPVTVSAEGYNYIEYFSEDKAGNFSSLPSKNVYIDLTPPATAAALKGALHAGIYYSTVQVSLNASDSLSGVKTIYYQLDGGATTTLAGSFSVSPLGSHTVKYWSVDVAGNVEAPLSVTFTIAAPTSQTITFPTITTTQVANSVLTLSATASSGLKVALSSSTPSVCTVAGVNASLLISGTCTIHATQPGDGYYSAAPPVVQSFTVHRASQTITFAAIATQPEDIYLPISATATSGLAVTFKSASPAVCTISEGEAILEKVGTCTLTANQPGNDEFLAAPTATTSFAVEDAQSITFPPIPASYAASELVLSAIASSGLTVTFTSSTPAVCTASGSTASLLIAGNCTIEASQAGNATFAPAKSVRRTFAVDHAHQKITFPPIPAQTEGGTLTLTGTASSGLPVKFVSITGTCTVSGDVATFVWHGTCAIEARQAGNDVYAPAAMVVRDITVKEK